MEAALPSNPNPHPLIESLDPHPPLSETLPFYDFNPPPPAEILASDSNAPPQPPLTETLASDAQNPFPNPQAATEKTISRRGSHSQWDPQPESENQSGGGETGSGTRKRKSRWADEEPKTIQLPDFMGGIEFDPEIQALNSRLLEIS